MRKLLLLAATILLSACDTVPETVPVSAASVWHIPPDIESRTGANIGKGMTRDQVVTELGPPVSERHFRDRPNIVVMEYRRIEPGPLRTKVPQAGQGTRVFTSPILFLDTINVYLDGGKVVTLTTKRVRQDEDTQPLRF